MKGIPIYCDHCKKTFTTSNLVGGSGSANITFENSKTNCPSCGQMAKIPDGTYSYRAEVVKLLSGPKATFEKLRELEKILKKAEDNKSSSEEIAETIKKELPEFSAFADWLKEQGVTIVMGLLPMILAVILHLDNKQNAAKQAPQQVVYQTTNNITVNKIVKTDTSSSYHRPKKFRKEKPRNRPKK